MYNFNKMQYIQTQYSTGALYKESKVMFREVQFYKHGPCAVQDPQIQGVYGYFKTALAISNKTDLLNTLRRHNIVPSNRTLYNGVKYFNLEEVRFCLNR
ncbi:unnamed protein product [Schistosoma turkestanicum]|nr:unnamed protein product [Schistosoma turkestanicum]